MMLAVCGWMEKEMMENIAPADKQFFRAKRFMDDILLAYVESPRWDAARFVQDMQKSVCYQEPLKLERGHDGTFLETRFTIENISRTTLFVQTEPSASALRWPVAVRRGETRHHPHW